MIANAAEINRLHSRIHETLQRRDESEPLRLEWSQACEEFHRRYDELCIPGGWHEDFYDRLLAGDNDAVESALCFLEVRPYFFRSGYHWKAIFQKCRRTPLSGEPAERLARLAEQYEEWRKFSRLRSQRGAVVRRRLWPLIRLFYQLFPAELPDYKLDGLVTVVDLYLILCRALKTEPDSQPDRPGGTARRPFNITSHQHGMAVWTRAYGSWRGSIWPSADVWATLVAAIREAYRIDASTVIGPDTILCDPQETGTDKSRTDPEPDQVDK